MSKTEVDPVLERLLQQSLAEALPERIEDDLANTLKYKLSKCLSKNSWYFTAAGLVIGGGLSYYTKALQPIAAAAILSPTADWFNGIYACRDLQTAYEEHRSKLHVDYKELKAKTKRDVEEQYLKGNYAR